MERFSMTYQSPGCQRFKSSHVDSARSSDTYLGYARIFIKLGEICFDSNLEAQDQVHARSGLEIDAFFVISSSLVSLKDGDES